MTDQENYELMSPDERYAYQLEISLTAQKEVIQDLSKRIEQLQVALLAQAELNRKVLDQNVHFLTSKTLAIGDTQYLANLLMHIRNELFETTMLEQDVDAIEGWIEDAMETIEAHATERKL